MHNPRPPSVVIQAPQCLDDFALQPNSRFKLESMLDLSLPYSREWCLRDRPLRPLWNRQDYLSKPTARSY
jgi:hypothetical protein